MSGVPDSMPDVPPTDDRGKYDALFFRLGGGVSTVGLAVISFFFYQGVHAEESLAEIAAVTHLRVEGVVIGLVLLLAGLCIAVGGPILSRKFRDVDHR